MISIYSLVGIALFFIVVFGVITLIATVGNPTNPSR